MSYLKDFEKLLEDEKLSPTLKLWEEYCMSDDVDGEELVEVLNLIKQSSAAIPFGQLAETILPMWQKIDNEEHKDNTLRLIIDIQSTNTPLFADLALDFLKNRYGGQEDFLEKIRLVGLRSRQNFQGAITNFELLTHMTPGSFVYHTGGWGVGEVMEISLLQEHVLLEFEGIAALKDLSFENAFKNLIKVPSEHFLARRFGDPDRLEREGKEDPLALVRLLLKDLGPKTAQEIKEELCALVIPEEDWTKWWQGTRTKLKKDTMIKSPKSAREPFIFREEEVPHHRQLLSELEKAKNPDQVLSLVYSYVRDFPEVLKNGEAKLKIKECLMGSLETDPEVPILSLARKLQACFLLEDIFPGEFPGAQASLIESIENIGEVMRLIETSALKKRVLVTIRSVRRDWQEIFLQLLFTIDQNSLRDYIFKELSSNKEVVEAKIHELLHNMTLYPEAFFWYFQKLSTNLEIPFNTQKGRLQFLEALLITLHYLETQGDEQREFVKKIHSHLIAKRYEVIRLMIEGGTVDYLREFLLLASKCFCFTKGDMRILHNLAEVVQPSLSKKKKVQEEEEIIWTTPEGYKKLQERIYEIGNVEMIDNAKEIEEARAHGDLRENAEYKFALERRSRLQSELKTLSEQINKARILTKLDISSREVGPGNVVELIDSNGNKCSYTLLGPWDADPDNRVLSFQSKFSQAMKGCKKGETFQFQGERYTVADMRSYLS